MHSKSKESAEEEQMQIYIQQLNERKGPYSTDEINHLLRGGSVKSTDLAWIESWAAWQPVANVPGVVLPPPIPSNASPNPTPPPPQSKKKIPGSEKRKLAGWVGLLFGSIGMHKFILGYTNAGLIMLFAPPLIGFFFLIIAIFVLILGQKVVDFGILLVVALFAWWIGAVIVWIIGIIEGIIYLSKSDQEFVDSYINTRRNWF